MMKYFLDENTFRNYYICWMFESESDRASSRSHRSRSRSRSRSRRSSHRLSSDEEQHLSSFSEGSSDEPTDTEVVSIELIIAFLKFFEEVGHKKGFIMSPNELKKLRKQQQKHLKVHVPKIEWSIETKWDKQVQTLKLNSLFQREQLNLPQHKIVALKSIFLDTSPIFSMETTMELYELLMKVIHFCLDHSNDSITQVRHFFARELKESVEFKFFNFRFSKIAAFVLKGEHSAAYATLGESLHRQLSLVLADQQ